MHGAHVSERDADRVNMQRINTREHGTPRYTREKTQTMRRQLHVAQPQSRYPLEITMLSVHSPLQCWTKGSCSGKGNPMVTCMSCVPYMLGHTTLHA